MRSVVLLVSIVLMFSACSDNQTPPMVGQSPAGGAMSMASESGVASSDWLTVPSHHEVLGMWRVIAVEGKRPPANARRNVRLFQRDHQFWLSWSDGVNEHDAQWGLTLTGAFRTWNRTQTLVGCVGTCPYPSGFGVDGATALRLTRTGQLVFVGPDGTEQARYRRLA